MKKKRGRDWNGDGTVSAPVTDRGLHEARGPNIQGPITIALPPPRSGDMPTAGRLPPPALPMELLHVTLPSVSVQGFLIQMNPKKPGFQKEGSEKYCCFVIHGHLHCGITTRKLFWGEEKINCPRH